MADFGTVCLRGSFEGIPHPEVASCRAGMMLSLPLQGILSSSDTKRVPANQNAFRSSSDCVLFSVHCVQGDGLRNFLPPVRRPRGAHDYIALRQMLCLTAFDIGPLRRARFESLGADQRA